jgi:hypothetical protein
MTWFFRNYDGKVRLPGTLIASTVPVPYCSDVPDSIMLA